MVIRLLLNIRTTYFRLFEWLRVIFRYYPREPKLIWIDFAFFIQYLWKNPHRVSKDFLVKKGEVNVYGFGETPLTTLDRIAKECRIQSKDVVYELGCGTARTCFWLHTFIKCQVIGVDYLPDFIKKANRIKKWTKGSKINFIEKDILEVDLRKASVIYLYGTCLEEKIIEQLAHNFLQLPPHTKVITVSYPLTDYSEQFKVTKTFSARFPWGKAFIFLNERI